MSKLKSALYIVLCSGLGLFAILFGGYLLYEKVLLSVQDGSTFERIGLISRNLDPGWFWLSVSIYTVAGTAIVIFGLTLLVWTARAAINGRLTDSD